MHSSHFAQTTTNHPLKHAQRPHTNYTQITSSSHQTTQDSRVNNFKNQRISPRTLPQTVSFPSKSPSPVHKADYSE